MSGHAIKASTLPGATLPPYCTRTAAATAGPNMPERCSRMKACTSWAPSGVAVRPVPMAQTGSYAMVTRDISPDETPARPLESWRAQTALLSAASYSALVSPTHRMASRPASSTLRVLRLNVSSVSLAMLPCRRSLCPITTYLAPTDLSCDADTPPVNAPLSSVNTSSAPTATRLPLAISATGARNGNGQQIQISISRWELSADLTISWARLLASSRVSGFIFQLPAMKYLRPVFCISGGAMGELLTECPDGGFRLER
mmetsp:Transcript_51155/g.102583  ORF Transcript_51155/g.102583 Transcript_51155/m.102583 type:complete len:258 (+) Transcript_51155:150-923(+)